MKSIHAFSRYTANRQTNQQTSEYNLRFSAEVNIIVNGYRMGMWRTLSTNTRCLLWIAALPRSVPKQIQPRERNMRYWYCGRVSDDKIYEPQVWSGWQKLYMWQYFLYGQWSNVVNFYTYFHSCISIWFLKDWNYFHVEKLCNFYCHFHFSTYWNYSSCPTLGMDK